MDLLKEYIIQWSVSNTIAILLLVIAIKHTKLARLLFAIMFALACGVNFSMAQENPNDYLVYATITPFGFYADFINGWFKEHITIMVSLIAIGQGLIALGMLLKGWVVRLACLGAFIFFMAITPLWIGAAFPFTIFTSVAIYFILKNDDLNWIWRFKSNKMNDR